MLNTYSFFCKFKRYNPCIILQQAVNIELLPGEPGFFGMGRNNFITKEIAGPLTI